MFEDNTKKDCLEIMRECHICNDPGYIEGVSEKDSINRLCSN